jgi:FAD/FMN-containing dehydrogenase/Fe-S oxidoreductase
MQMNTRIREIPYNYTSFSDHEIVTRFLGEEMWSTLNSLREQRRTGRSARMLFDVLGDMWVISRNPYIQDDLIADQKRWKSLISTLHERLDQIVSRAAGNQQALQIADAGRKAIIRFENDLSDCRQLRQKARRRLERITAKDNIHFDGLMRVSHVTDASDWRVEYPFVVITPDTEAEVRDIVEACIDLGLTIIPRGGGTGYTGSAVPLHTNTAIINTEKLLNLGEVASCSLPGVDKKVPVISVQAGVVTRRVAEKAYQAKLVFAVDPTSQDASCIGGNIAMNAGGKKAVMWGTTLDNLVSWRMVTPDAKWLQVDRLDHNLGKIHLQESVRFQIQRFHNDGLTTDGDIEILEIPGSELRCNGLGKDVTNKFLGGLPGIQKEGCDGLITSARFILHRMPKNIRTVCLEFFGNDLHKSVSTIVDIIDLTERNKGILLSGLEHLDERYVRAVGYTTKAARAELPRMILLIDISSDNEEQLAQVSQDIVNLARMRDAEGFIATSAEARHSFWVDRSRTAAIAAHTNAFKINEDVVIPLPRLAEYTEGIERINIIQSTRNKLAIIHAVEEYLSSTAVKDIDSTDFGDSDESHAIIEAKIAAARDHLGIIRDCWTSIISDPDKPALQYPRLAAALADDIDTESTAFSLLQSRRLRISYRHEVEKPLKEIFSGNAMKSVRHQLDKIHTSIRASRLFVATHMHAGDGNVHTNIPVHSNDYEMLHQADLIVDEVMRLAQDLGGVISGEHGIGLTKIQYLHQSTIDAFSEYKQKVDPNQHFNRGKLLVGSGLGNAYTPSLRLLEQEALILEASALGELNNEVKDCLRCGKCKPVCTTHIPAANLLYSPRNKVLASGLLVEAFLYEEQTRRGISTRHFDELNDIADHCTICHRCLSPCPVDIDFGEVSSLIKNILLEKGKKRFNAGNWLAMSFLNVTNPRTIRWLRLGLIKAGYQSQRWLNQLARHFRLIPESKRPGLTLGQPEIRSQVVNFIRKPLPSDTPGPTLRALLDIEQANSIPIIQDADKVTENSETVFYFPGCGSERLFSQIGMATLAMLHHQGVRTVLPPGYLCCGYPQTASGDSKRGIQMSTDNQVLMHRIANTLSYLDIRTIIVSCGTCLDQLLKYQLQQIFPGCRTMDIHEYLMEKGLSLESSGKKYLYHEPCHSPMKHHDPVDVASKLLGADVLLSDRCCGESGTFAISRPDIATQVRYRKQEELFKNIETLTGKPGKAEKLKILTSCPSCQQGMARYEKSTGLGTDYIVVELAASLLGENWMNESAEKIRNHGIERVLL